MKKMILALSSAMLVFGPSLSWTADQPNAAQPSPTSQPSAVPGSNANPISGGAQATQTPQEPPADWTTLKGMVQMVDASAKTVQIKDDSGQLLQVAVDRQVKITKDGARVKLSQIKTGDVITLAKKPAPTSSGSM